MSPDRTKQGKNPPTQSASDEGAAGGGGAKRARARDHDPEESPNAQQQGEEKSVYDKGRGARKPSNPSGERKQGGRKESRKSTGFRESVPKVKRSGSESGAGKNRNKGGPRGARGR